MILVGIDVAKEKHFAAAMGTDGTVQVPPFSFFNDHAGFDFLLEKLSPFEKDEVLIGLESTAHYADNLIAFLFSLGYQLTVINPIQTAALRKTGIRKTKTDKADTFLIIKSLMVNKYRLYTQNDLETQKIRSLCRFRQNLKKSNARLKVQLVSYVDIIFPELQYFFKSGIHIKTCYQLLKSHPMPDDIVGLNLTYLSNLIRKTSRGYFGKEKAIELRDLARSSVGTKNINISIQITQTIAQIELLEQQLGKIEAVIEDSMLKMESVIMSVPGIGYLIGAMILGEIGDIHRFHKPCQLLAYAGLDPTVNQSGKFQAKKTKMSKRGSPVLRYALISAAWHVSLNNKTFDDYYNLKRSQGLGHYAALGHVANKLVRVVFKLLRENIPFNLD